MAAYEARQLSGRLSDGAERGRGTRYHAVPAGSSWAPALCGAKPGRHSGLGFTPATDRDGKPNPGQAVTCPRCLRKLGLATSEP